MKFIFILGFFLLLLVMMLARCKEEPRTIKSSDIKDSAITPNMHGCGIGILSDKKTGRVEGILYEEMQFVRIEERDSLLEELNKCNKSGVFQDIVSWPDGMVILQTKAFINGTLISELYAADSPKGTIGYMDSTYFVPEITDSIIKAHQCNVYAIYVKRELNK